MSALGFTAWPRSISACHDAFVSQTRAASSSPCRRKPVRRDICAIGASTPKFQTVAATMLVPAVRYGARS